MLANADDARASHFTIVLDKSQYSTNALLHDGLRDMQQAALLVGNNALFTEENFTGYTRKIGSSNKEHDSHTVGQFGRGAMTAYSLTDAIQLISGNYMLLLDPHAVRLPNAKPSLRGNIADPQGKRYIDIQQEASSQIEPFVSVTAACEALPNLTPGTEYPGTLFRLALRTPEAAADSLISKEAITAGSFQATTLKEFCEIAPDLLLFTRSIDRISVYVRESADSDAVLLHECIATRDSMPADGQLALDQVTVSIVEGAQAAVTYKVWAVATNTASAAGTDGVAALLYSGPPHDDDTLWHLPKVAGKVYHTMPLPLNVSGLPVHLNGSFWVLSDRRKLWSGEGDRGKVSLSHSFFVFGWC